MITCLICKTPIDSEVHQFGETKAPICGSCYLDGGEWVYEEPCIVYALERGATLEEAKKFAIQESISDLEKFMDYFFEVNNE